jgi:hypothetical protein
MAMDDIIGRITILSVHRTHKWESCEERKKSISIVNIAKTQLFRLHYPMKISKSDKLCNIFNWLPTKQGSHTFSVNSVCPQP